MSNKNENKVLKWEYRHYHPISSLPSINVETDRHKKREFYRGLEYLIRLLWNDGIRFINYAHISFVVPKSKLPLKWKQQHYCISFLDHSNNLILIFMKVIPYQQLFKKYRGIIWQKERY